MFLHKVLQGPTFRAPCGFRADPRPEKILIIIIIIITIIIAIVLLLSLLLLLLAPCGFRADPGPEEIQALGGDTDRSRRRVVGILDKPTQNARAVYEFRHFQLRKDEEDTLLDKDDIITILNKYAKKCV